MEVHFTPEQEAKLAQLANNAGTDTERLVKDAPCACLPGMVTFPKPPNLSAPIPCLSGILAG